MAAAADEQLTWSPELTRIGPGYIYCRPEPPRPSSQDRTAAGLHCTNRPTNRLTYSLTLLLLTTPCSSLFFSLNVCRTIKTSFFVGSSLLCNSCIAQCASSQQQQQQQQEGGQQPGQCKVKAGSSSQQRFSAAELNCQTETGHRVAQPRLTWSLVSHTLHPMKCHKITSLH